MCISRFVFAACNVSLAASKTDDFLRVVALWIVDVLVGHVGGRTAYANSAGACR